MGQNALLLNTADDNTAVGDDALLFNTTGTNNTAVGKDALRANVGDSNAFGGDENTAVGKDALRENTTGGRNTAVGKEALRDNLTSFANTAVGSGAPKNSTGSGNVAVGLEALVSNDIGGGNVAVGNGALGNNTDGRDNIALGGSSGANQTTGSFTIYIGNNGIAAESNTTRLGDDNQTRTFISGIHGVTTAGAAIAVFIDASGQLGTVSSSLRYKKDVRDMGALSAGLQRLRPVTFHYKQAQAGGLEYGLIAEEVAEVFPDIVVYDDKGRPETVQYRKVNAMLLNEVQHQHQRIGDLEQQLARVLGRLAALEGRTTSGEE